MYVVDTICALATPLGGALAVLRISGENSAALLRRVFSGGAACARAPRRMCYGSLVDAGGAVLEDCMAVCFAAPRSYSGEDMAEIYIHGGAAGARRALSALLATGLCRPAEPGEFTKRAFLNGKMSLTRAEAVMDLIGAQTARAAMAAQEQLSGALQARLLGVEEALTGLLSGVSAAIDYPEELEEDVESGLTEALGAAREALETLIENGERAKLLREGARVVIAGRPNAGKSSLLNALLGEERAIVTAQAGTTRDLLEANADFDGVPVRLTDTAGLREASDEAERIGVARARAAVEAADLLLIALDASRAPDEADRALLRDTQGRRRIVLLCKSDLPAVLDAADLPAGSRSVSARSGEGIEALKREAARLLVGTQSALLTNARHIEALKKAVQSIAQAERALDLDCAATDLRDALAHLGSVTGSDVDARVIEEIFKRFCVGK